MTEKIVTTSLLLDISKMQAFDIIGKLPFEFIYPAEVESEVLTDAAKGYGISIPN
jgi:hypothetical protein